MLNRILSHISEDIAIDLGTATSLVYVRGRGIVIQEPSVVAVNQKTGQVLSIGEEAKKMVGRTPGHIVATRPLVQGVVSDFEVTEQMLRYFIEKVHKRKFIFGPRPRVIVGIPCGVTEVEKKAVRDATMNAGAREVFLIEEPMAAAIGARLAIQEAGGNFLVDIGGGTTEVAVISLGGIVTAKSLRIAGDKLNEDIIQFAQDEYKLLIGERTAEEIKIGIGSAFPMKNHKSSDALSVKKEMPMRGRNLVTGLPALHAIEPTAMEHGRVAGANMAGRDVAYRGSLLMNIVEVCHLDIASFGAWDDPGAEACAAARPERFAYRKLLWRGDRLVGATILGKANDIWTTNDVGMLKGLVQSGAPLGPWKAHLRRNPFDVKPVFVAAGITAGLLPETTLGMPAVTRPG